MKWHDDGFAGTYLVRMQNTAGLTKSCYEKGNIENGNYMHDWAFHVRKNVILDLWNYIFVQKCSLAQQEQQKTGQ